jgi:hypothetical protein
LMTLPVDEEAAQMWARLRVHLAEADVRLNDQDRSDRCVTALRSSRRRRLGARRRGRLHHHPRVSQSSSLTADCRSESASLRRRHRAHSSRWRRLRLRVNPPSAATRTAVLAWRGAVSTSRRHRRCGDRRYRRFCRTPPRDKR